MFFRNQFVVTILVLAFVSATTACSEEAAKRPRSTAIPPSEAEAIASLKKQQAELAEQQRTIDDTKSHVDKPKNEAAVTNPDVRTADSAPVRDGGTSPQAPDQSQPNFSPQSNTSSSATTNPDTASGSASDTASDSTAETVILKTTQATMLASVTDGSKVCNVMADKAIVAADVERSGDVVTFKLLSLNSCTNLANQNVVGISSHIKLN